MKKGKSLKNNFSNLVNIFTRLNPLNRRLILIFADIFLIAFCIFISIWLTTENLNITQLKIISYSIVPIGSILGAFIYVFTGQYKGLTKYTGLESIYFIFLRNILIVSTLMILGIVNFEISTIKFCLVLVLLLSSLVSTTKIFLREALLKINNRNNFGKKKLSNVVIYGAGDAGAQLAQTINIIRSHKIISFIDDNKDLYKRSLFGIPINSPNFIISKINEIDQILLAIPSLTKTRRKKIVENLQKQKLPIMQVPSIEELTTGKIKINKLRPIEVIDLLGRESVPPNDELLTQIIYKKVICITGAGGSIGSELAKQIIFLEPKKLILIDNSEPSLYRLQKDLRTKFKKFEEIKYLLGNVADYKFISNTLNNDKVEILFHTAAYKHVPLVETNPIQGLKNNVFSSYAICKSAKESKLEKVVLISSDKAVRPTNIMGASKRLSELIFQSFAAENQKYSNNELNAKTVFCMVRFGNVLNSSGSVVPLFKEQISKGGPITITDPNIIRYFMTIKEASQLVIQAAGLARGGEILLLDMGKPIKIIDLAHQMINLSGLTVKNIKNPNGEIEVVKTGLRPGEKLFEELLITGESKPTKHPLIYKAIDNYLESKILNNHLSDLYKYLEDYDIKSSLNKLKEIIPEWEIDNIYKKYFDKE